MIHQLHILFDDETENLKVAGDGIRSRALAYMMLESAKDAIRHHHSRPPEAQRPGIVLAQGSLPVNNQAGGRDDA